MRRRTFPSPISGDSTTARDKFATAIVSQNVVESQNNRTRAVNDTQINRDHQSSVQVR